MRITNKKDISAYVYKIHSYLFENHPNTIRSSNRGRRRFNRKRSVFYQARMRALYMSFEKYGY